ncbi:hypothetical protein CAPTEDRAFT_201228 [Capitella teleta]|uniref:Uncharacterized protein n=1 Tax=Capitella teleta TaxID=283909 RepID=R7VLI8_CAPTE|nr:hypothetical protein CAPTEDRAFT_201228 [Capitella teleta]|eukprot:ELU18311.1 hypothetical protein CAPTEDRAFT_201228 [Capitella teleta]
MADRMQIRLDGMGEVFQIKKPSHYSQSVMKTIIENKDSLTDIQAQLWWIQHKQDCLQQPAGADDRVGTIRVQLLGAQQQHASLSAQKSIHSQPVLTKWDIAVGEVHRLRRFHKRGPFDMTHVIV